MNPIHHHSLLSPIRLLALAALALAACAAPAATPNDFPTAPALATATALPPTAAATAQSTVATDNTGPVPATSIALAKPQDVAVDADGNLYVSDCGNQIDKIDSFGELTVYAGGPVSGFSGDGGPARSAQLSCPVGLSFDRDGNLYVADLSNHRIRRIDRNGLISTVVGSGTANEGPGGFAGDGGPATAARLNSPTGIAFDPAGNLYIADSDNNRIRKVDRQGIITTVAGTGAAGFSGDGGPATAAELHLDSRYLSGVAVDAQGQVYFADSSNARVRMINSQGLISTVAGDGGPDVAGDGGPATAAALAAPTGLTFDGTGNLYLAESDLDIQTIFDVRVRKIDGLGTITTTVGTGAHDLSGDGGPAVAAGLNWITGIRFDPQGNLYVVDLGNVRVRKVDINGIITTVVGGHY